MYYSVCVPAVLGSETVQKALHIIKEAGFTHYEIWDWWNQDINVYNSVQQEEKLTIAAMCTHFISLTDPACRADYLEGLQKTAKACCELGCKTIISQVGQALKGVPDSLQHDSIVNGLRECLPVLKKYDLTLVIEPLNTKVDHPGYYLWRAAEAFDIVDEVGDEHVKVLYDLYHQAVMDDLRLDEIVRNIDKIGHFHMAGCPGRHEPLTDNPMDYSQILDAIRISGYKGSVGLEYFPVRNPEKGLKEFMMHMTSKKETEEMTMENNKMKAVFTIAPKTSVIREVDMPKMDDDSVLIKTKYCGVCYSEHYDWAHSPNGGAFGHEPMGVIAAVGKNVKGFEVGDRVSGLWGSTLPGAGAMVEYAVANVKHSTIIKLPDNVRDEDLMVEPLSCMFSAASKVKDTMPGTRVCVVGCGYMGCGAISLLKLRGFYVVAVDIRESSRQDARTYGADEVYTPEEALEKFRSAFSVVCEWGETNESLDLAINLTAECGRLHVGAYHTGPKREVDMQQLGVKAIVMDNTHPREPWLSAVGARNAVRMLGSGEWEYKNIPTMVYPMDQFDRAQEELETKYGHHMKSIINMEMLSGEPYMAE